MFPQHTLDIMGKQPCTCGCGHRVTQKLELQHINSLGPSFLASEVLAQNQGLVVHKKPSQPSAQHLRKYQPIGMSGAVHQQLSHQNNAPGGCQAGSGSTGTSLNIPSSPIQPLLHNDILPTDAALDSHMMVDDLPGTSLDISSSPVPPPVHVYGLSTLHCSGQIANNVEQVGQQQWVLNNTVHFTNDREENEEENKEEEDVEPVSDFYVDSDKGLEGGDEDLEGSEGDDDDDELIAGQGQEGISLWDTLGEGFLKKASQLGMSFNYYSLNIF